MEAVERGETRARSTPQVDGANTPQVVVDLDDGRGPQPASQVPVGPYNDLPYFIATARAAGRRLPAVERFVISYSPRVQRQLTEHDVWLLVGDERATPLPVTAPCPVLRTYGDRFGIPSRGLRDPVLTAAEIVLWARNHLDAARRNWPHFVPSRRDRCGWLPLGMPAFRDPPTWVPQLSSRGIDVGFRGSVRSARRRSPKTISRQRMGAALARLPSHVIVDFEATDSFVASYTRDPGSYAETLLQTKICLAPRGGSVETFRAFEGALAGCVLITEPLPKTWFYKALPRIELRTWSELPGAVEHLLSQPGLMESMSSAARRWATNVVGPDAVGEWIARRQRSQNVEL